MQLPAAFRPSMNSLPPMYAWPRSVKQVFLAAAIVGVLLAYALLAGGIIAILAVFAEWFGA